MKYVIGSSSVLLSPLMWPHCYWNKSLEKELIDPQWALSGVLEYSDILSSSTSHLPNDLHISSNYDIQGYCLCNSVICFVENL